LNFLLDLAVFTAGMLLFKVHPILSYRGRGWISTGQGGSKQTKPQQAELTELERDVVLGLRGMKVSNKDATAAVRLAAAEVGTEEFAPLFRKTMEKLGTVQGAPRSQSTSRKGVRPRTYPNPDEEVNLTGLNSLK